MNKLDYLFRDAHRRAEIQCQGILANLDLSKLWAGLGYASEFKGHARVFFQPMSGHPPPRSMGWYKFTAEGEAEYLRRYAFSAAYLDGFPKP
jgi:hypothetical protein